MAVPYTFGTATASIPLSQLDSNFATTITLGNTAIQLGNTVTTLNNMTLANVTVSSGNVTFTNVSATTANVTTANITTAVIGTATITTAGITTANVTTANVTTGIITTANVTTGNVATLVTTSVTNSGLTTGRVVYATTGGLLTSSANLLYSGTDLTVYGLTVGRGGGAVATNTAVGSSALQSGTVSGRHTAVGYQAGYSLATAAGGGGSTFIGYLAGYSADNPTTTFAENTFVGARAGYGVTTGVKNTFIGTSINLAGGSGSAVTTGNNNVIIGNYTGSAAPISATGSNYIVLSDGDGNVRQYGDSTGNMYIAAGNLWVYAPAPTAPSAAVTLTAAQLATDIINTTGTTYTVTLPLASAIDTAYPAVGTSMGLDFHIVNTATGVITIAVNTGITSVGLLTVSTATSAHFRLRRTAAATYILYRLS